MKARLFPHSLSGEISAVASKSYAHRLLIAAALSGGGLSYGDSDDAARTAHALASLGFQAKFSEKSVQYGDFIKTDNRVDVSVGESGSTLRFLLPLAAALGVNARFLTEGRLGERPMAALTTALSAHGVRATANEVKGQLTSGRYEIDATVSSQFVTGLLMALPLLAGDSEIVLCGRAVSAPYIEITLDVLEKAGIEIERTQSGFFVKGGQHYRRRWTSVPGDYSGAAFLLVAGAFGAGIKVKGLDPTDKQGDKAILDHLRAAGASILRTEEAIEVRGGELRAFTADVGETPDLAPILAVLAAKAKGESALLRVSRLKDKESDRLFAIRDMLSRAGISSREEDDRLLIAGGAPHGGEFRTFSDHRMAMSEAILAAFAEGESSIDDMLCVKKSYPRFWEDYAKTGGKYEVER